MKHLTVSQNKDGRDFAVGDIHGCYDLLTEKLSYVGFNKMRDRLFCVGDLIDRGPDSEKCLGLLDKPWFYSVRGNHEQMMLEAIQEGRGGSWWAEYGMWARKFDSVQLWEWSEKVESLPHAITLQTENYTVGISHAEPDGLDWNKMQSKEILMWGRQVLRGHVKGIVNGVDITLHGHTPVDFPEWKDNRYFMDTGSFYTDELTVRKIEDIYNEYSDRRQLFI